MNTILGPQSGLGAWFGGRFGVVWEALWQGGLGSNLEGGLGSGVRGAFGGSEEQSQRHTGECVVAQLGKQSASFNQDESILTIRLAYIRTRSKYW